MIIFLIAIFSIVIMFTILYLIKTYHWFTTQILKHPKPILHIDLGLNVSPEKYLRFVKDVANDVNMRQVKDEYHIIVGGGNMTVDVFNGQNIEIKKYEDREKDNSARQ